MNYEVLDSLIITAIEQGCWSPLYERAVCVEATRLADASGRDDSRIIDGRLQALRRAGKIEFSGKGKDRRWRIKP